MSTEAIQHVIKELVQTLRDGQAGFENAAGAVKDPALKSRFLSFASERGGLADDLAAMESVDSDENKPSLSGSLHRGWIHLKATLTSGDDHAILEECERGEDHALSQFNEALDTPLPLEVLSTLEAIQARIQAVHDEVKTLRDERA